MFGGEQQLFDLTSYTRHIGRDTTGNLLSKGALLDRSRLFMKGLITIEKSAVGHRFVPRRVRDEPVPRRRGRSRSRRSRSTSRTAGAPCTRRPSGPIDPAQLFYLESRGIPPDEARKFIVLGFLEPVVARVPLESARDHLRELLEAKWAAGPRGGRRRAA